MTQSDFSLNIKTNYSKSNTLKLDFNVDLAVLNQKALPMIKIVESYSSNGTLIKFDVFKNALKLSILNGNVFSDVLVPVKIDILQENEYITFLIESEKFTKFISFLSEGHIKFSVDLSSKTLGLSHANLLINLQIRANSEFMEYEHILQTAKIASDKLMIEKIKQSIDFCNLIFSKDDSKEEYKDINISDSLIFSRSDFIGSSCVKFSSFGALDHTINFNLIKIISQTLSLFKEAEVKMYKTDKFFIFKDTAILFAFPISNKSGLDIKDKIENLSFNIESKFNCSINRKQLIQTLSILSIFLRDLSDGLVNFTFSNQQLRVSVIDQVTERESFDTFSIDSNIPESVSISLNFDSILKNLKYFINRENVDLEIIKLENSKLGIRIVEEFNSSKFVVFFVGNS